MNTDPTLNLDSTPTSLPSRFSMDCLEKNLEALAARQPKLVQRISWPVDGSHILFNGNDSVQYRLNLSLYPLNLPAASLETVLKDADASKAFFVFGIGLGEIIDALLERFPGQRIMAWERDPWLLRLFLMQKDYSEYLGNGNLHLLLCADLIHRLEEIKSLNLIFHPFLKEIYSSAAGLIDTGLGAQRILINTGGLFVDHVSQSFKELGYSILHLDLNRLALEEIEYAIIQFMPQRVLSINYQNGLAELCAKFSLKLLCWEIDHTIDDLAYQPVPKGKAYIFSYRKKNCDEFAKAGFEHVHYLPMATDPQARSPQILPETERERYEAPIAFVGNILFEQARNYRMFLQAIYEEYCRNLSRPAAVDPFQSILALQAEDYSVYRLPELFAAYLGDFKDYFLKRVQNKMDPVKLLAETAAAEKRLDYVKSLSPLGIRVWGDTGWHSLPSGGVRAMGPAGHRFELNKIYSGAVINLEINRLYQPDMVNMRVFDIMACGGFLLAEYTPELAELFRLDQELIVYHTKAELLAKAQHYLHHPAEARAIALRGLQAVREKHTIRKRVEFMLQTSRGTP